MALSDTEVAKMHEGDARSESVKMEVTNSINSLILKFIRIDFDEIN